MRENENQTKVDQVQKSLSSTTSLFPSHSLACRDGRSGFGLCSLQALVAVAAGPLLLQQRHTGASHSDGHVDLCVGVAAADAGARSPQDDRGSVHRRAAVLVALLAVRSHQAALTQAVGLRDVAGIPGWIIGDPARMNSTYAFFSFCGIKVYIP